MPRVNPKPVVLDWHASISQERQKANAKLAESVAAHCGVDVDGEIILSAFTVWRHKAPLPRCLQQYS